MVVILGASAGSDLMPRGLLGFMLAIPDGGSKGRGLVKIGKRGLKMKVPGPGHGLVDVECKVAWVLSEGSIIFQTGLSTRSSEGMLEED